MWSNYNVMNTDVTNVKHVLKKEMISAMKTKHYTVLRL
jgi:hypothetical protein